MCEHVQREFVNCTNGEVAWKCVSCGDVELQYQDTCSGG
jgi:hypothetical protein